MVFAMSWSCLKMQYTQQVDLKMWSILGTIVARQWINLTYKRPTNCFCMPEPCPPAAKPAIAPTAANRYRYYRFPKPKRYWYDPMFAGFPRHNFPLLMDLEFDLLHQNGKDIRTCLASMREHQIVTSWNLRNPRITEIPLNIASQKLSSIKMLHVMVCWGKTTKGETLRQLGFRSSHLCLSMPRSA